MQKIQVYNTLTKEKEEFQPLEEGKAKIYVCGVTPYNHPHIGNARPFVTWDVIHRYLEFAGYEVVHVQNFTDVDDKIINAARMEETTWDVISGRYINAYFDALDRLNVRRVDVYPLVSDHMQEIIDMIQGLLDNGHAYILNGDVYYDISTFQNYGKLSGRDVEEMLAGARVEINDEKRNPGDFALWKAAKPGEPTWTSPWGEGRPGWHIECSAMSIKYLGDNFDFHGGGSDLIFPHHENEIAQSEGCTGHPFVNYWLHNGFITINQEKMSKSLDNFFLVKDILEEYSADALRYFLISTHYRSPLDFSDERLTEAERTLARMTDAIQKAKYLEVSAGEAQTEAASALTTQADKTMKDFIDAMNDDFNTALAIGAIFSLVRELNVYMAQEKEYDKETLQHSLQTLRELTEVLGIIPNVWQVADATGEEFQKLMTILLELRQEVRNRKMYDLADAIRDRLAEIGIMVEDGPEGAVWKKSEI